MNRSQTTIDQVTLYIDSHLESDLRREEIAAHVHYHVDYLTRMFKKEKQISIKEYITQQKMYRARYFLHSTRLSVKTIGTVQQSSFEDMLAGKLAQDFVEASWPDAPKCQSCHYYPICRGGCRRDCEPLQSGEGEEASLNIYCDAYLAFFTHAMDRMQQIARMKLK